MFAFSFGSDDDARDALRKHMEEQSMVSEVIVHQIQDLLSSMNIDQLTTLRLMFHQLMICPSEAAMAAYYQGQITALLYSKGVCTGCGRDHAQELIEETSVPEGGSE